MRALVARITVESAFGTPLRGDTLFGQLCWMLRYRQGNPALNALLEGYADGRPFVILSDAFPHGRVARPVLPPDQNLKVEKRKADRKKTLLPLSVLSQPLVRAVKEAVSLPEEEQWLEAVQLHNSISRQTGTTGSGHDPFQLPRRWPGGTLSLDIHVRLDESRLPVETLQSALADIGQWGFGRDASTGLGRFRLETIGDAIFPRIAHPDCWLTLAPCAPQGMVWNSDRSYWRSFTRFGRHGAEAARGHAFKAPIVMADTGAVLTPAEGPVQANFVGRGLGGDGSISQQMPETVHQGYAPAIPVSLGEIS